MPKILWMSPYSLHDTSSGASVDAKDMLESLVQKGFEVWSCASFVFDSPNGTTAFGNLEETLQKQDKQTFILDDNGIHYVYTRCQSRSRSDFTLAEGQLFYETYLQVLDEFQPDIVFGYGLGMESCTCFAEAKRRGISTVYLLVNGNHGNYSFPNIDLIITDSQATSDLYAQRDQINVVPTGAFFNKERFYTSERAPQYVTFVNPSPSKGLAIFAKLAHTCQKELPNVKFLVVNTRANFSEIVSALHVKGNKNKHPYTAADFPNVDMVGAQKDMRPIFKISHALIAPSLWYESWGRVTTEAVLNKVPVLASKSGGLVEAIAGAGINLIVPEHCVEDFLSIPTNSEIKPWVDALKQILETDYSEAFVKAEALLSNERSVERVIQAFEPLYSKRPTDNPLYFYV